jgi:hypothetical protein
MGPTGQPQLLLPALPAYLYHEYVRGAIKPCMTHLNDYGNAVASLFHLLSCGHIVAVYDNDQRCGRNCQHASAIPADSDNSQAYFVSTLRHAQLTRRRPHVTNSQTQAINELYCETCSGIPIDRYQRLKLSEVPHVLRQCYALTRSVLYAALGIDEHQLDAMLSPPFLHTNLPDFDWRSTHRLHCGHLVLTAPMRPCASNCAIDSSCQSSLEPQNVPQDDAILCQECVFRSDLVFTRYAKVEQAQRSPEDSGYRSAGPQPTSSFGDYGNYLGN